MHGNGKGLLKDLFTLALLIVIVVIPIRVFVISPFVVDGESMHPTFENLDYLIVDELVYRFEAPQRGDVIVFRYPNDPSIFYIKRIIGLPNETVAINHGIVTITTAAGTTFTLDEPYIVNDDATYSHTFTLGPSQYFVMGDNLPTRASGGPCRARTSSAASTCAFSPSGTSVFPRALRTTQLRRRPPRPPYLYHDAHDDPG